MNAAPDPATAVPPFCQPTPGGIAIAVKAQPGARRDAVAGIVEAAPRPGWPPARLRVATAAPPEDGRANAAILRLLADALGVKPAVCTLAQGHTARDKLVVVKADAAELAQVLARLMPA